MVADPVALMLCHHGEAAYEFSISWDNRVLRTQLEKQDGLRIFSADLVCQVVGWVRLLRSDARHPASRG